MEASFNCRLLAEATRIGDEVLARATPHGEGLAWKTAGPKESGSRLQEQTFLYEGACGISWFLLALYRQTGRAQYLDAGRRGLRRAEARITEGVGPALLTGGMSIPFTQLAFYRVTGHPSYLHQALETARSLAGNPGRPGVAGYIGGAAGTLLALLHLHQAAPGASWLLEAIDAYAGKLLDGCHLGRQGLYWDRSAANIRGLCGYSHGAAGIGHAFLEMGHLLGNGAFCWVAEQAFAYEEQFRDAGRTNWACLRQGMFDEAAFARAYGAGDLAFFTEPEYTNAWCYGAAGIGLSRLRAYELLKKDAYLRQARQAAETTRQTDVEALSTGSLALCHGSAGNADLFLEAYRVTGEGYYLALACSVATRLLAHVHTHGSYGLPDDELSLFAGSAGIGYFYLRLLDPAGTPSVLAPSVPAAAAPPDLTPYRTLSLSPAAVQRRVLQPRFGRTLSLLDRLHPEAASPAPHPSGDAGWDHFVQSRLEALPPAARAHAEDVFGLERTGLQLDAEIVSDSLLGYKTTRKAEDAARMLALPEEAFRRAVLTLDADLCLAETRWDWTRTPAGDGWPPPEEPAGAHAVLLTPTLRGVTEKALLPFTRVVLEAFAAPTPVAEAVREISARFDALRPEEEAAVATAILGQVRQAVQSGMLLDPGRHPLNARGHAPAASPVAALAG